MVDNKDDTRVEVLQSAQPAQTIETAQSAPRIGRPPKKDILAKTRGHIAKRGRPPGEAAAMAEFKARLINSPKSRKVLEKIFDAALNDEHKNQGAAWKLIVERLAPLSSFEKGSGGKAAITINISGLNDAKVMASEEPLEGEFAPLGSEDAADDYEENEEEE